MTEIDRLREIELELLEEFIAVCTRESLEWYASHGTLLGAVRNGGFLLWDDDIDILMPTEDFNKLMLYKEWFKNEYFLQTPIDEGRSGIVRLCKNGTTAFDKPLRDILIRGGHHGICIDILPLDEIGNTGYYHWRNVTIPKTYFQPVSKMKFEHLEINVPNKARKVLDLLYGYWHWPAGAYRPHPHNWFFDTKTDYSVYVKRYTGWLEAIKDKKIYLFGAGDSLRVWLKNFGSRERIVCTFDNDRSKWGKTAFDIPVANPAEIPNMLDDDSVMLIVSLWHNEIGQQLECLGIRDYYVFLDDLFVSEFGGNKAKI